MLLDLRAHGITVLIGHDDVGDYRVRRILVELRQCRSRVGTGNNVHVLATKGDLDDFAHGGAVIDEIHSGCALDLGVRHRGYGQRFTHRTSLSAMSPRCVLSSTSRMASSIRSVAERSTVCCGDGVP